MGVARIDTDGEGNGLDKVNDTLHCAIGDPINGHREMLPHEMVEKLRQALNGADPELKEAARESIGDLCKPPAVASLPEEGPDQGRTS